MDIPKSTFYGWYQRYDSEGFDGLVDRNSGLRKFWNRIPDSEREKVVKLALELPADVYAGRKEKVLTEREEIKQKTMKMRRKNNLYNHEVEIACS